MTTRTNFNDRRSPTSRFFCVSARPRRGWLLLQRLPCHH